MASLQERINHQHVSLGGPGCKVCSEHRRREDAARDGELERAIERSIAELRRREASACLHDRCRTCGGTGNDLVNGRPCTHMISCPCPSCTPRC